VRRQAGRSQHPSPSNRSLVRPTDGPYTPADRRSKRTCDKPTWNRLQQPDGSENQHGGPGGCSACFGQHTTSTAHFPRRNSNTALRHASGC
jgi:hypothetical protein